MTGLVQSSQTIVSSAPHVASVSTNKAGSRDTPPSLGNTPDSLEQTLTPRKFTQALQREASPSGSLSTLAFSQCFWYSLIGTIRWLALISAADYSRPTTCKAALYYHSFTFQRLSQVQPVD
ncbi:hypothetical protein PSPO01_03541 [Paraphaeosphaeria sporulosa]